MRFERVFNGHFLFLNFVHDPRARMGGKSNGTGDSVSLCLSY